MEKKLIETTIERMLQQFEKRLGEEADVLIITHSEGECGGTLHGSPENIAQSLFVLLHQTQLPIAETIYRIIKLNVLNILNNDSPYAIDLLHSINNLLKDEDE